MKEQIKTVYYCDHCNEKRFVKNAMVRHEIICKKNPNNKRACYGCLFLTKEDFQFEYDSGHEGGIMTETKKQTFCTKKNIYLATHYQEIKQHDVINYDGMEMMPKSCDVRKDVYHEIEEWSYCDVKK